MNGQRVSRSCPANRPEGTLARMRVGATLLIALASVLFGCKSGGPFCDAQALSRALGDAAPGDVVQIGACTVPGPITVPAGVTLEGTDPDASRVAAPADGDGVVLTAGDSAATLAHVTVQASGIIGVHSTGPGAVSLEDVHVLGSTGVGVFLDGTSNATLTQVHLVGPITTDPSSEPAWLRVAPTTGALPACTGTDTYCAPDDTRLIACPGGCAPLTQVCNPAATGSP